MSHELKEGTSISNVSFPDGSFTVGENASCMTIREQLGQMSMVPWIRIEVNGRPDRYFNCALAESIELAPVQPGPTEGEE